MAGNFWERRLLNQSCLLCLLYQWGDSDIVWTPYQLFPPRLRDAFWLCSPRLRACCGTPRTGLRSHSAHAHTDGPGCFLHCLRPVALAGTASKAAHLPHQSVVSVAQLLHISSGSLEEAVVHSWRRQLLLQHPAVLSPTASCSTSIKVEIGMCTCKAACSGLLGADALSDTPSSASLFDHLLPTAHNAAFASLENTSFPPAQVFLLPPNRLFL